MPTVFSMNTKNDDARLIEFKAGEVVLPLGHMVDEAEGPRFYPNVVALLAVLTPLGLVTGWALPRIIKALKKKRR